MQPNMVRREWVEDTVIAFRAAIGFIHFLWLVMRERRK
jgi:hypothetical protein